MDLSDKNNDLFSPEKKHYSLQGIRVCLEPYKIGFVKQYHSWFEQYPELLHLTGSQMLSLQQQIINHQTWVEDINKYTFIIFEKEHQLMIGDVNLFFSEWIQPNQAEINIMIAKPDYRCKGYASQVLEMIHMFVYGICKKTKIIAKIKSDNIISKKFFMKQGYVHISYNHYHDEDQYHKQINNQLDQSIIMKKLSQLYQIKIVPSNMLIDKN